MYKFLLRPLLFLFNPEKVHHFVSRFIKLSQNIPGISALTRVLYKVNDKRLAVKAFGLEFENPVGLAAGFDKDGKLYEELGNYGFSFIEVGTTTPKLQSGNDRPRLFRLKADRGLINRMGFNNEGVEALVKRLKKRSSRRLIVGGNIGKNKMTPNEDALNDYLVCFKVLFDYVDYFAVNLSSPNMPSLRKLQEKESLKHILTSLQEENFKKETPKPILLKIAPDLSQGQLNDIIEIVIENKIDGLIATNTTISREDLKTSKAQIKHIGSGGVSGKPIRDRSTEVIRYVYQKSGDEIPIIAAGGVFTAQEAKEKLAAGAVLVQLYTGFIYEGPGIVKRICKSLLENRV